MSETRSGDYKRCSGFVEIEVSKADNYEIVIRKIAACLEIEKSDVYSYGIVCIAIHIYFSVIQPLIFR